VPDSTDSPGTLLRPGEPVPFRVLNEAATRPVLLVCEHASCRIPGALREGIPEALLDTHFGCDHGAGPLTELLAARLNARAVLGNYSRLVVDCNRRLDDPTLILPYADDMPIPANRDATPDDRARRVAEVFEPFHAAVSEQLESLRDGDTTPVYLGIHSFTPVFRGHERPWHVGTLWDFDPRVPVPLIEALRQHDDLCVGDNEPYSGKAMADYSVDFHAEANGYAHVAIEVRQDLLTDDTGIARWAGILGDAIAPILERPDLYRRLRPDAAPMGDRPAASGGPPA
jgi:predicted N-formylglutamate amidohydrolase